MGMQWPAHIDLLPALGTAPDDLEIARDGPSLLVIHNAGLFVANPRVSTTTTRVHPHDVLEAKVIPQGHIDRLDGHCHELPTFIADVGLVTARPDIIVVCQIDIEAQFFSQGFESRRVAQGLPLAGVRVVDGPNLKTGGHEAENIFAESGNNDILMSETVTGHAVREPGLLTNQTW